VSTSAQWCATVLLILLTAPPAAAQSRCHPTLAPRGGGQVADTAFDAAVPRPAFATGQGPLVLLDEGHFNFHTLAGRYAPFARLLRRDGFEVRALRGRISPDSLAPARILVIANALGEANAAPLNWSLPIQAAFQPDEIEAIQRWVSQGGSLFLIADHMPFPGAVETLARAFGILLLNGFATDSSCSEDEFMFRRSDGTLSIHPITQGRGPGERVDSVRSFTGEAFRLLSGRSILTLEPGAVVLLPTRAWSFSDSTPRLSGAGMWQGGVLLHGRGRVAVFGEAAMFSAQLSGTPRRPMGMNAPNAGQNAQLLLNVVHWLAGLLHAK
jgi:hypothetical protein